MTRIKLAVFAGSALLAAPAFADDTTEPAAGGTVEAGGTATDPAAGGAGTGMAATGTATGEAPTWWSRSLIDRPYVVNKGKIGAYADYGIVSISFDIGGMTQTATGDGFGIGAGYGITDKITAGLQYGFTPGIIGDADSEIKGALGLFGEYQIMHDAKLDVTASADFDLDLCAGTDMNGDCVSGKAIHAGLGARYTLAPKMALFTGAPYGPGPVGQHLSISLETDGPITFAVPVGFMYQATPELNVHLGTELANLSISNSDSVFFGADYINLSLGGLYSVTPNIDVAAMFLMPDLKEAGFDLYAFTLGARYYN
jgi:hypothetical protein